MDETAWIVDFVTVAVPRGKMLIGLDAYCAFACWSEKTNP
jgi:hypothetical protein